MTGELPIIEAARGMLDRFALSQVSPHAPTWAPLCGDGIYQP
jgi:hypothetical protein